MGDSIYSKLIDFVKWLNKTDNPQFVLDTNGSVKRLVGGKNCMIPVQKPIINIMKYGLELMD